MRKHVLYPILLMAAVICPAGNALGSPTATITETQYNAGAIDQGVLIAHDFTFKNTGDEPLTLKVNDCGCGGLTFKTPSSPINPGKIGTVTVNIPTIHRKGDLKREVKIETNDPVKKDLKIVITARIDETLSIMPLYIDFGPVKNGSVNTKEILFANTGKKPLTIVNIETAPAGMLTIPPTLKKVLLKPGDKKSIVVTLIPSSGAGHFEGSLIVKTDLKHLKEKKIVIRAEMSAR